MPGVCPACGRDLRLEEIVASMPKLEDEPKARRNPLGVMESGLLAFAISWSLGLAGGLLMKQGFEGPFLAVLFTGTPHFFLGLFSAGFFSRTVKAQLLLGTALGFAYALASVGMIYVGCRGL